MSSREDERKIETTGMVRPIFQANGLIPTEGISDVRNRTDVNCMNTGPYSTGMFVLDWKDCRDAREPLTAQVLSRDYICLPLTICGNFERANEQ
ncbi:unnamed protein product [Gongylonema pulchrum]|uniref:ZP domain-containing protein n=1 Tax=Gongylonema pulchrum TaxID=637853 RepID=A0A183E8V6_9BILA|nr:unnamed protein product [Gongylonema pulchrum]